MTSTITIGPMGEHVPTGRTVGYGAMKSYEITLDPGTRSEQKGYQIDSEPGSAARQFILQEMHHKRLLNPEGPWQVQVTCPESGNVTAYKAEKVMVPSVIVKDAE